MPEIRLQDYTAKIKDLVRDGRHDEAIAHCKHILTHYPKHVETYGLLGEACLEKGLFREAIEFFQRTLSADPESFIARVGLGIICDEQSALPEAIWHMERAFELSPGNRVVRKELQRLYAQRDGVEKARLKLNRAALGRLYARNGLYERAISEYRAVLREDPDLPGVRVALVEALWHEGRRLEAVESCLDLLNGLPNCLKANLILGEIWLRSGNEEAGEERLKLVRALDPENKVAQEMMGRESPLPAAEVCVPELKITSEVLAEALSGVGQATSPIDRSLRAEEPVDEGEAVSAVVDEWAPDEETMDWLEQAGLAEAGEPEPGEEAVSVEEPGPATQVPPWLQELVGDDLPDDEPAEPAEVDEIPEAEIPAWLQDMAPSEPEPEPEPADESDEEGAPGWAKGVAASAAVGAAAIAAGMLGGEEDAAGETTDEIPAAEEPVEEQPPAVDDVPESLKALVAAGILDEQDLQEAMAGMTAEDLEAQRSEDVPDWLQELTGAGEAGPPPQAEVPAEEALEEEGVLPEAEAPVEMVEAEEAGEELGGVPVEMEEAPEAPPAEDVPDWLQELGVVDTASPAVGEEETPSEELPDWLKELGAPAAAVGAGLAAAAALKGEDESPEEAPVEETGEEVAEDRQAVAGEAPEEEGVLPEAEAPVEMVEAEEVSEELGGVPVEMEEAPEAPPAEDVPDWLQEVGVADAASPAVGEEKVPSEELPDWLKELGAPAAAVGAGLAAAAALKGEDEPPEETPVEEEAAGEGPVEGVPESLWALVEAGILDEADLEEAMAGMTAEDLEAQRTEDVPDWLKELVSEESGAALVTEESDLAVSEEQADSPEAEPEWLEDLADAEAVPADEEPEIVVPENEGVLADEVPQWLKDLEDAEAVPATEEMAAVVPEEEEAAPVEDVPQWLRDLADEEEEAPALAVEEEKAAAAEDVVPQWLKDLAIGGAVIAAKEVEAAVVEEEEVVAGEAEAGVVEVEAAVVEEKEVVAEEEVPAWLADLAPAADEAEAEVVEAEAEVVEEEEVAAEEEVPAWLADLAPAADEAEAEVVEEEKVAAEEEVPAWLTDLAPAADEAEAEVVEEEIVSADEETPAWLEDLAAPAALVGAGLVATEATEEPEPVEGQVPVSLRALVDAGILDEADLEEAMAEMSSEELEAQRAEDVPDWLQDLMGAGGTEVVAEAAGEEEAIPAVPEAEAPVEETVAEEEVEAVVVPEAEAPVEEIVAEEEVEAVVVPEAEAPVEEFVEEEVVEAVLEPEAPVEEEIEAPEPDEFIDEESLEVVQPEAKAPAEQVVEKVVEPVEGTDREDLVSRLARKPRDYEARLDLARLHREQHEPDAALDQYEKLISARQFLPEVIADLKLLSQEPVDRPRLYQLLGDAYMQNNELDQALEMYRAARQALTQR